MRLIYIAISSNVRFNFERQRLLTKRILATCPSCRRQGYFVWLGDQCWPEPVARRLGVPSVMSLWSCPHCSTTVSELALIEPSDQREDAHTEELPLQSDDSAPLSHLTC
jgi:hypothetical protein